MNKLIDKIKYTILYNKIEYPLLHIVKEEDYDFLASKDIIFKQRDISLVNNIKLKNQKYNSIILEKLETIPLKIIKILSEDGVIYSFINDDEETISKELSKFFKFIKLIKFNLNLEFIPEVNKEITSISLDGKDKTQLKLLIASNHLPPKIEHTTSISIDYLKTYLNKYFIDSNKYIKEKEDLTLMKKNFNKCINKENLLIKKQELIKTAIKNLLKKTDKNEEIIKKNKQKINNYKLYNQKILKNLNKDNYKDNYLTEITGLEKLINLNIEIINKYISFNKANLQEKCEMPRNTLSISIKNSKKDLEKLEKIYEENNSLIEQNNLYVTEIYNLKFDLKETLEEKEVLILTIKELETQLNLMETQKSEYYSKIIDEFKKKTDKKVVELMESNKKLKENINDLTSMIENIEENNKENIENIKETAKKDINNLKLIIKKLKEKNNKNLLIIDEKSVYIQKLNRTINTLKDELNLKDELINKKNLIIRENKNTTNLLKDEIENKNLTESALKKELQESNKKINSIYYKELYEEQEKELHKLKRKYQELINTNQEYKSEIEEYELKIQELIGYNERITKEMEIDIDINDL